MIPVEKVLDIVYKAGEVLVDKLESGFSIEKKGSIDLVTDADRASEEVIIGQLNRLFPEHSIYAEESGWLRGANDYVWFADPLDGTTNFAHGVRYFSVSLGLMHLNELVLGIVYNPVSKECFVAEKGGGAYLNNVRIQVSTNPTLKSSLLVTGFPYDVATTDMNNLAEFGEATKASQGVNRMGSAALDLCHVACGRFDAFWERGLQPWDLAAGSLIVAEAGGKISDCAGKEFRLENGQILASNALIHDELLQILNLR